MPDPTTNYGWNLPNVGADSGAWGELLNDVLNDADTELFAVSGVADAALPKAGGTMTGAANLYTATMKKIALAGVSGTVNLDLSLANTFTATITGTSTIAFTNTSAVADTVSGIMLYLTNGGSATVTWPASVLWASNAEPVLTTSGKDLLTFVTFDNGVTWIGAVSVLNAA